MPNEKYFSRLPKPSKEEKQRLNEIGFFILVKLIKEYNPNYWNILRGIAIAIQEDIPFIEFLSTQLQLEDFRPTNYEIIAFWSHYDFPVREITKMKTSPRNFYNVISNMMNDPERYPLYPRLKEIRAEQLEKIMEKVYKFVIVFKLLNTSKVINPKKETYLNG